MRAVVAEQADLALGVAEGDQILAEQLHTERGAVDRHFFRQKRGKPVSAQCIAHGGSWPNPAHQLVLFSAQHGRVPAAI